jgi:hypothetical protein
MPGMQSPRNQQEISNEPKKARGSYGRSSRTKDGREVPEGGMEVKIYLAHNFAARLMLRGTVRLLEANGHEVTSTWITDDSHIDPSKKVASASVDLVDIDRADALLLFTDQFADRPSKGKFVEFGYALAKGKKVFIFGVDRNCIFYNLPGVYKLDSIESIERMINAD